ncbi:MAG: ABC transporter permease [Myxococcota bacterium]
MSARRLGLALTGLVLAAWVLSWVSGYDVKTDVHPDRVHAGPSAEHWLGTDKLGRDVFWRLVTASRAFVPTGALAATVAGALGVGAGAIAGWFGGVPAALVRYVLGVVATVPRFVLVLLACAITGGDTWALAVASGVAYAPTLGEAVFARLEGLRRAEFVLAARAHGLSDARILGHHLLWVSCRGLVARHLCGAFGYFLLLETTLSYLGSFGVQEPTPSWGNMLALEFGQYEGNAWAWIAPVAAIWIAMLGTTLVGEVADD